MAVEEKRRELKLFELKKVLSYASEVLEARRKRETLTNDEIPSINKEIDDWMNYMRELQDSEDETKAAEAFSVGEIVSELTEIEVAKRSRKKEIDDKITVYDELIETLYYYIFFDGNADEKLYIKKDEIDINFIEEYIYLFTEIYSQASRTYDFDYVFDNKQEFAKLIFEVYGKESFDLIKDILTDDCLNGDFTDYVSY